MLACSTPKTSGSPIAPKSRQRVRHHEQMHHPGVDYLHKAHPWYVGGRLSRLQLPAHYDFRALRFTPADASEITKNRGIAICAPIAPYDVVSSPGAADGLRSSTS